MLYSKSQTKYKYTQKLHISENNWIEKDKNMVEKLKLPHMPKTTRNKSNLFLCNYDRKIWITFEEQKRENFQRNFLKSC